MEISRKDSLIPFPYYPDLTPFSFPLTILPTHSTLRLHIDSTLLSTLLPTGTLSPLLPPQYLQHNGRGPISGERLIPFDDT